MTEHEQAIVKALADDTFMILTKKEYEGFLKAIQNFHKKAK